MKVDAADVLAGDKTWMHRDATVLVAANQPMTHTEGLDRAYASEHGVFRNKNVLFVAGTRSARDAADDLLIPLGLTSQTQRFRAAEQLIGGVRQVVGHSLGGAVALELAKKHNLRSETYGAPVLSVTGSSKRHKSTWDPVAALDFGAATSASSSWNPHSYRGM